MQSVGARRPLGSVTEKDLSRKEQLSHAGQERSNKKHQDIKKRKPESADLALPPAKRLKSNVSQPSPTSQPTAVEPVKRARAATGSSRSRLRSPSRQASQPTGPAKQTLTTDLPKPTIPTPVVPADAARSSLADARASRSRSTAAAKPTNPPLSPSKTRASRSKALSPASVEAATSESLFYKKHSKAALQWREARNPKFETEEQELEWMFPALPSDSSLDSTLEADSLKNRVSELDEQVKQQKAQIIRLEEMVNSLKKAQEDPASPSAGARPRRKSSMGGSK